MCGRYAASRDEATLVEEFDVQREPKEALQPDYNVAPTKKVYLVADRVPRGAGTDNAESAPERELAIARWGLIPSWAKDPKIGNRLINARLETLASKPSFRAAFAKRRCLLPADGYYEWYRPPSPTRSRDQETSVTHSTGSAAPSRPVKQPYYIHPTDGSTLAMAGLYEFWRDPEKDPEDPESWLRTTTVVTTRADAELRHIHDRMPVCVAPENWSVWLDPDISDEDQLRAAVSGLPEGFLRADPISTAVNNVRNNGPDLLRPIPAS